MFVFMTKPSLKVPSAYSWHVDFKQCDEHPGDARNIQAEHNQVPCDHNYITRSVRGESKSEEAEVIIYKPINPTGEPKP